MSGMEKQAGRRPFFDEREDETTEQLMERIKAMKKEISGLLKAYKELNKAIKIHKSRHKI